MPIERPGGQGVASSNLASPTVKAPVRGWFAGPRNLTLGANVATGEPRRSSPRERLSEPRGGLALLLHGDVGIDVGSGDLGEVPEYLLNQPGVNARRNQCARGGMPKRVQPNTN